MHGDLMQALEVDFGLRLAVARARQAQLRVESHALSEQPVGAAAAQQVAQYAVAVIEPILLDLPISELHQDALTLLAHGYNGEE